VLDVAGDLADPIAGREDIDGHPDLDPPAAGQWQCGVEGLAGDAPLSGQWLHGPIAGDREDPALRQPHDPAAAAAGGVLPREVGDGQVGLADHDRRDEGGQVGGAALEVCVDEEQRPTDRTPLDEVDLGDPPGTARHRGRLALVLVVPHHGRPGGCGDLGRVIGAAVVHDNDEIDPGDPLDRGDRGSDALGLILGRDEGSDAGVDGHDGGSSAR